MHKLRSDHFFKAYEQACVTHQSFTLAKGGTTIRLLARDVAEMVDRYSTLAEECAALGLSGAAASINRAVAILKECPTAGGQNAVDIDASAAMRIQTALSQATSRIPDDLSGQVLLALDPRRSHLFENIRPFGDDVFQKFPSARMDIEDAAKCLAVERGTACVFHIMRALESAARVIAAKIGATVQDEHGRALSWGIIADNMKPKIDAMTKGSDEQVRWYRVQQDLVVINRAWRVPTNHPKESYSPDEAQEIFDATKAFMRELASLV
jgi:hypothetical protein